MKPTEELHANEGRVLSVIRRLSINGLLGNQWSFEASASAQRLPGKRG